jgi:hypothetical protein
VFPAAWLANATASNKKVLNTVLDEEQKWADEANERRTQARVVSYVALGIGVLVALLAGAVSVSKLSSYKRRHTPQFDDKYFRDVPTDDHPAVLGALLNDGEPTDDDMSAALVRLTDIGALKLEKVAVESRGVFGRKKSEDDYALTRAESTRGAAASKSAIAIDRSTLKFFGKVLSKCKGRENDTLYFSDFEKVAKDKPEAYNDAYENWKTDVKAQVGLYATGGGRSPGRDSLEQASCDGRLAWRGGRGNRAAEGCRATGPGGPGRRSGVRVVHVSPHRAGKPRIAPWILGHLVSQGQLCCVGRIFDELRRRRRWRFLWWRRRRLRRWRRRRRLLAVAETTQVPERLHLTYLSTCGLQILSI